MLLKEAKRILKKNGYVLEYYEWDAQKRAQSNLKRRRTNIKKESDVYFECGWNEGKDEDTEVTEFERMAIIWVRSILKYRPEANWYIIAKDSKTDKELYTVGSSDNVDDVEDLMQDYNKRIGR